MKKENKFIIGISLLVSAITTMVAFISLCIKKKNVWGALLALAATESLVGLALIEDKVPHTVKINFPRRVNIPDEEIVFEEPFEEASADEIPCENVTDGTNEEEPVA